MARLQTTQLNIRSAFARARVREIARDTGMTATEIVEDALRGYAPAALPGRVGSLVRRGPVLVKPARNGRRISLEEANAALDAAREREP
ncbi:MAG: hypothetical protein ABI369_16210 [Acetobacteraceae bacterium]